MALEEQKEHRPYRVLWAVDPFASDYIIQGTALMALHSLINGMHVEVTPVYLYGAHLYKDVKPVSKEDIQKLESSAHEVLQRIIDSVVTSEKIQFQPLVVIAEPFLRKGKAASELIQYAKDQRSDCILLSTHSRKGVGRLILGSFAEELTLKSEVPVLTANPYCDVASTREIIFATDFSDESERAFQQVVEFAHANQMSIKIFHQARYLMTPVMRVPANPFPIYDVISDEEIDFNRKKSEKWMKVARDNGISIETFFNKKERTPAEGILEFSETNPGILALTARSSKLERIFVGSTTRRVLREACYPCWIVHPERKEVLDLQNTYRTATSYAVWQGGLKSGHGTFSSNSGAVCDIPYTYSSRFEKEDYLTPESLLGTAEAACVAMSFATELEKKQIHLNRVDVNATVHMENFRDQWVMQGIDVQATAYTEVGNRIPVEDAFDRALEASVISNVLTVPINSKLEVRSPDQVVRDESDSKSA